MASKGVSFEVSRTPPGRRPAASPEQVPVLELRRFAPTPKVSFGTVRVGATHTIGLIVQNPTDQQVELTVEKVPDGFSVDTPSLLLAPLMDAVLAVHWTPAEEGNVRGVLGLRCSSGVRTQAVLLGTGRPLHAKKKKGVLSAAGSRFRKPQALHSRNASAATKTTKPRATPRSGRENRPPRVGAALTEAGRQLAQPCGLLQPPAGPLNSTHRLETSADCSTLLDVLRTPPDFSVSLIRSEDAPGTPARRRDARAARQAAAVPAVTPRRQTFVAPPADMGSTFRLETGGSELPPCTVPESPMRRQTFVRTDGPTLGSVPFGGGLEPVEEAAGDGDGPRQEAIQTPQVLRRGQPRPARSAAVARASVEKMDELSPDDWMKTPALFGKTAGRMSRGGAHEQRSDREECRRDAAAERTREQRSRRGEVQQSRDVQSRQIEEAVGSEARKVTACSPVRLAQPTEEWMKTPALFGRRPSGAGKTDVVNGEPFEPREEQREVDEVRRASRSERRAPGTKEHRGSCDEDRYEVCEDEVFEIHGEQHFEVREEERVEMYLEERLETLQYSEECQEYVVHTETEAQYDEERTDVVQTPQLFSKTRRQPRSDRSSGSPLAAPVMPTLKTATTSDARGDAPAEVVHRHIWNSESGGSARSEPAMMPTPQLFSRTYGAAAARAQRAAGGAGGQVALHTTADSRTTWRRAAQSQTVSTSCSERCTSDAASTYREERATCVHEEIVEEETLIRHVFARELDVGGSAPGCESPRLLRSRRSSHTEETRCYSSPVRGRQALTAVLSSPHTERVLLTPTGGRRCSTLVKRSPDASAGSAAAKRLFAGDASPAVAGTGEADASLDRSDNLSSETYVKSPPPAGLAVPCVLSPPPPGGAPAICAAGGGGLSLIREESSNLTSASGRNLTYSLEETKVEAAAVGGSDRSWTTVDSAAEAAAATDVPAARPDPVDVQPTEASVVTKPHVQRPTGLLFFPLSPEQEAPPAAAKPPLRPGAAAAAARRSAGALARREAASRPRHASPPSRAARRAAKTPSKPRARAHSLTVTPGKARVVRSKSTPSGAAGTTSRRSAPAPVRQRKLVLSRSVQPVATQPNPFAASNMFYDKDWVEKQERGFTAWLNFILTPSEYTSDAVEKKVDAAKILLEVRKSRVPPAPSRETLSLREYTAQRRLNRLRLDACRLFERPEMTRVIRNLEVEVEKGGLLVRRDRALHADMGLKQLVLQWLLGYHPLWLRLGLETVYGEIIHLQGPDDLQTLARFITGRLLWSPDLAARHRHPSVPHLYGPRFELELKQFTLKKFLLLVLLLDTAKRHRLIKHDPCLFNKHANIKASRDLLVAFSREMLAGEGDITKHLAFHGYQVSHRQTLLDEFNYAVTNIAVDLRCGVRLTRVVELLRQQFGLTVQLRVPAVDRQQKIHNSRIALRAAELGLEPDSWARSLVDGHRERTLHLLWLLVFKHQIDACLDLEKLRREVARLETSLDNSCFIGVPEAIEGRQLLDSLPDPASAADVTGGGDSGLPDSASLRLLTRWARLVCAHYGLALHNLSASFCDGRAYCYLLYHYQPALLRRETIRSRTSATAKKASVTEDDLDDSLTFSYSRVDADEATPVEELRRNEKANLNAAFDAMSELGGVPVLSGWTDYSGTLPDRRLVAVTLTYLCGRLLELGAEVAAARTLQLWWRRRRLAARRRREQAEAAAAVTLQSHARRWLAGRRAALRRRRVLRVQAACRGWLVRRQLARRAAAATVIARRYRARALARQVRADLERRRVAAVRVQRWWRHRLLCRRSCHLAALVRRNLAASRIQRWYRGLRAGAALKTEYRLKRRSAVAVQRWYRSLRTVRRERERYLQLKRAAVTIQTWHRSVAAMRRERDVYLRQRRAVTTLQRWRRSVTAMRHERRRFLDRRRAAATLQAWYRGRRTARSLQAELRRMVVKVVIVQSRVRAFLARRRFVAQRRAALAIQSNWRSVLTARRARDQYLKKRKAIVVIQKWYRSLCVTRETREQYLQKRQAALILQTWYRSLCVTRETREQYLKKRQATIVLQHWYRSLCVTRETREQYLKKRQATIVLQHWYRSLCVTRETREQYLKRRQATIVLQHWYRSLCVTRETREQYLKKRQATTVLQTWYRSLIVTRETRKQYLRKRQAVIIIQHWYRFILSVRRSAGDVRVVVGNSTPQKSFDQSGSVSFLEEDPSHQLTASTSLRDCPRDLLVPVTPSSGIDIGRSATAAPEGSSGRLVAGEVRDAGQERRATFTRRSAACDGPQRHSAPGRGTGDRRPAVTRRGSPGGGLEHPASPALLADPVSRCRDETMAQTPAGDGVMTPLPPPDTHAGERIGRQVSVSDSVVLSDSEAPPLPSEAPTSPDLETSTQSAPASSSSGKSSRASEDGAEAFCGRLASHLSPEEGRGTRRDTIVLQWQAARRPPAADYSTERHTPAAVTLQRAIRQFLCRRRQQRRRQAAAVLLQRQFRLLLARRQARRRLWAIVVLQSAWRGRAVRRRVCRPVARARSKIEAANRRATADLTLGSRTSVSLDFLLRYRDLGHMKAALGHLEAVTRLSVVCCRRVVDEGAVPVLYTLMNQCNRSMPHMDVISLSLSVLLHIAKHPETEHTVHQADNWCDVLISKMSVFREKGPHIFIKAATLLAAILRDPFMVQVALADRQKIEQLRSLHRLAARRHRQQQQQQQQRGGSQRSAPAATAVAAISGLHLGRSTVVEFSSAPAAAAGVLAALGLPPE